VNAAPDPGGAPDDRTPTSGDRCASLTYQTRNCRNARSAGHDAGAYADRGPSQRDHDADLWPIRRPVQAVLQSRTDPGFFLPGRPSGLGAARQTQPRRTGPRKARSDAAVIEQRMQLRELILDRFIAVNEDAPTQPVIGS
jgi:hypothetical protein